MDQLAELIEEIRRMNHNVEELLKLHNRHPEFMKIPEAAAHFGMAPQKFRSLCRDGIIPCVQTNDNPKIRHLMVNVEEARKALLLGGYLHAKECQYERKETRGRKPKVTLKTK